MQLKLTYLQPSKFHTSVPAACCSKSPSVSNTVFCPSSLLASAGAHQVVIFYKTMQAGRCPTDELSLTNCAVVSEKDLQSGQ
ncbi:hypothetical protein CHARACLAT_019015 [Characodon lateralis]|uniref:Uncharacterized protein n=1 Tax=Characodon lateralis TaxID=208331 RepID=A0ABU7D806_9TELE|nr:hypothetical protein [Characodon lateralis]